MSTKRIDVVFLQPFQRAKHDLVHTLLPSGSNRKTVDGEVRRGSLELKECVERTEGQEYVLLVYDQSTVEDSVERKLLKGHSLEEFLHVEW